uniref:Uncharacterized protein n=1 Tax=viral metagenome TaxID=1070528 RepID=A0A6M3JY15_9ZZZZ
MRYPNLSPFHELNIGSTIRFGLKPEVRKLLKKYAALPEPTKENTSPGGAHQLIDMLNHFLSHEVEQEQDKLLRGFFKLIIMLYDDDHYWWERIDEAIAYVKQMDWEPKYGQQSPRKYWWAQNIKYNSDCKLTEEERIKKAIAYSKKMRFYLLTQLKSPQLAEMMLLIQRLLEGLPVEYNEKEMFGEIDG